MQQKLKFIVSPNEILSDKSFGVTLFDITVKHTIPSTVI